MNDRRKKEIQNTDVNNVKKGTNVRNGKETREET